MRVAGRMGNWDDGFPDILQKKCQEKFYYKNGRFHGNKLKKRVQKNDIYSTEGAMDGAFSKD